eukprot:scaffold7899_cov84-Skeletonema_dohrnii-CCMP3373.AAC.1
MSLGTMHPQNDEKRQTAVQFGDTFDAKGLLTASNQVNLLDSDDEEMSAAEIDPTGHQPNEEVQTSPHSTNPVQDSDKEMARVEEATDMGCSFSLFYSRPITTRITTIGWVDGEEKGDDEWRLYYGVGEDDQIFRTTTDKGGCRLAPSYKSIEAIRLALDFINEVEYPGPIEAVVGETKLSRGSDCDAVWFLPSAYEDSILLLVAQSIEAHLFGQGRAIDVGAFVGYHTVRLAKAAAPFDVYAFEGRPPSDLNDNIKRNNAVNVHIVQETVDENWKLSAQLEQDLLNEQDKGPLALIKIDCEGCELHFLKGAKTMMQLERMPRLGGQRMIQPTETRKDVLDYLTDELGYVVESLRDEDGEETWDYLAYREAEGEAGELTTKHHPLEHVDYRVDTIKEEDKTAEHRSIKQHLCVIKSSAMKKVESSIIIR